MSNVVSDYVHLFAGMVFGGVITYILTFNPNSCVKLNVNVINQSQEISDSEIESLSYNSANDLVCDDDTSEEETNNEESNDEETNDEETKEEPVSENEEKREEKEEQKIDELKLE